jgi:hypothetical protein
VTNPEKASDRTLAGKCFCGGVHYAVADEFIYAANCHCSNCRRTTGSAFKPWETDAIACRLSSIAKSNFWPTDDRASELHGLARTTLPVPGLEQPLRGPSLELGTCVQVSGLPARTSQRFRSPSGGQQHRGRVVRLQPKCSEISFRPGITSHVHLPHTYTYRDCGNKPNRVVEIPCLSTGVASELEGERGSGPGEADHFGFGCFKHAPANTATESGLLCAEFLLDRSCQPR